MNHSGRFAMKNLCSVSSFQQLNFPLRQHFFSALFLTTHCHSDDPPCKCQRSVRSQTRSTLTAPTVYTPPIGSLCCSLQTSTISIFSRSRKAIDSCFVLLFQWNQNTLCRFSPIFKNYILYLLCSPKPLHLNILKWKYQTMLHISVHKILCLAAKKHQVNLWNIYLLLIAY